MPASRAARNEDPPRIDPEPAGMAEQGLERGAALLHDFGQAGVRGKRVVDGGVGDAPIAKPVGAAK